MPVVLAELHDQGRKIGIVTAKRHRTVQLAFDRFPWLEDYIGLVVASEDTERHKPDPDPVLAALERFEADPGSAAYVGDSPFDIRSAKGAGVFAVGVGWGGIHPDERLLAEEPDAYVREPEELLRVL
jgi:pyrophosphatase PpaX